MTENLIIPTPTGPSQPPSLANSNGTSEDVEDPSGEINCICECTDDDGFTICCDKCDKWQHLVCVELTKETVPIKYFCPRCSPRYLDVQKAKDLQRQRMDDERAKRSHKKKRPPTNSHKKKDSIANGHNGTGAGKVSSNPEKTASQAQGKPPSPREGSQQQQQQQTTRKRGNRAVATAQTNPAAVSHQPLQAAPDSAAFINHAFGALPAVPPPTSVLMSHRNGDFEGDMDFERSTEIYKVEYTDMQAIPNQYVSSDVQSQVSSMVSSLAQHSWPKYSRSEFNSLCLPKTSVCQLPDSAKCYAGYSRWSLLLQQPCAKGKLVTFFKGVIGIQEVYKSEPINQYSLVNHPKRYVLFHPNLPIYIDARTRGLEARFVRRSCRPNLALETVIIEGLDIQFGLFAVDTLRAGMELTVGWDWNTSPQAQYILHRRFDLQGISVEDLREAARWAENLAVKMGECACLDRNDCLLTKMKNIAPIESSLGKVSPPVITNGRKQRIKAPPLEPNMSVPSKESSPISYPGYPKDEEDDDNRSTSTPSSRSKPLSRDLTPVIAQDIAVGDSGRETRKPKDLLVRAQVEELSQSPNLIKRRKRNSTISLPSGNLATQGSKDGTKAFDRPKHNPSFSQGSLSPTGTSLNPQARYMVTDASFVRKMSDSPTSSDERKDYRRHSTCPLMHTQNEEVSKSRTTLIAKPRKSQYVDTPTQTERDAEEENWWMLRQPPQPPKLGLRKRLMVNFVRDREETARRAVIEEKKRKRVETAGESPGINAPQKSLKVSPGTSKRVKSPLPHGIKPPSENPQVAEPPPISKQVSSSTTQSSAIYVPDPNTRKHPPPPPLPRPAGPTLENIFADADGSRQVAEKPRILSKTSLNPSDTNASQEKPHTNGSRSIGLQLQLPTGPSFPTAPTTGSIHGTPTPTSSSVTGQSPLTNVSGFSPVTSASLNASLVQPSPTIKKLSLQEYKQRKGVGAGENRS